MALSETHRYHLRVCLYSLIPAFLGPFCTMWIVGGGFHPAILLQSAVSAVPGAVGINAVEFGLLPRFRRRPFYQAFLARLAGYVLVLGVSFVCGIASFVAFSERIGMGAQTWRRAWTIFTGPGVQTTFQVAVVLLFLGNLLVEVALKVGRSNFLAWVLGRYHQPREEDRVFMFLDLKDSTPLAERFGPLRFSLLVRDFFDDVSEAVLETKGEVSHYIGDEAVISWRRKHGLARANCVRCYFRALETFERKSDWYRKQYGLVPRFKAGVHLGRVVATDIGTAKSEIVFHGDVLNTTARITGLCSELGEDLLVSKELVDALAGEGGFLPESMGLQTLKGKAERLELFALRRPGGGPCHRAPSTETGEGV
ncbi:MAG: adenylate/guanylate cyclase domain-containing protein [Fimbriimonadaceae bacterium]|nr:adenylate/guanylate cyclase domain-containing protein [Fimbriimonadaceae bacterium]